MTTDLEGLPALPEHKRRGYRPKHMERRSAADLRVWRRFWHDTLMWTAVHLALSACILLWDAWGKFHGSA